MIKPRKTGASLGIGIVISLVLGAAFAIPAYLATDWIWPPLQLALAIGIGGYVAKALFVGGYQHISVPVNHHGIATRFGDKPTGVVYDAGDHWGFPGISGAIPVDMRHRRIDLAETMTATAADTSDVGVDGFVLVRTGNALDTLNVEDIDESVRELFESCIRLFTAMVSKAENAVQFRDLLAEYLELEPRKTDVLTPEHEAFKKRLERLETLSPGTVVSGGIDALMEKDSVGEFKRLLKVWGDEVEDVEIEKFDIPQVVKDANLKKATQTVLMAAERIRNTARKGMVDELVASGVNANTAMNSVDMLLGLSVKKDVKEITITDLDKVAEKFGEQVTAVLRQFFVSRQNS